MITSPRCWGVVGAMALGAALLSPACSAYSYNCEYYSECAPEPMCTGQCVPLPPFDFSGPALLWMGQERDAPQCPARAPRQVYQGHADLDASNQCPPCACSEPACVLPSGLTANSQACPGGGTETPFEAPGGWDGSCTAPGMVTSLASVSMLPVTQQPCAPIDQPVPQAYFDTWGQYARACAGEAITGVCGDPGMTCLPTAEPPPPGFRQCIMYNRDDDPQCPAEYPDKFVFYGDLTDTRDCTACECSQTEPSECVASLSIYEQPSCMGWILSTMVGSAAAGCHDMASPSVQLGSMEATWLTNQPGACEASGGVPVGEAKPLDPRTFCCQPPPG